jgi:hypothetical protein
MEANCRPRTPLSNLSEETLLLPDGFFTELGPQVRLLPVPNFGVNTFDLWFFSGARGGGFVHEICDSS